MKYYRWMNDGMVEFEHHPDICSVGLYVTHEACQNAVEERAQESRSFQRRYYEAMDNRLWTDPVSHYIKGEWAGPITLPLDARAALQPERGEG